MTRSVATLAFLSAICAAPAFAQDDAAVLRAVMNRLHEMQSREGVSHGFVIHEGDSPQAVVPVQIAGSGRDGTSFWRTAHEFSLARDSLGSWVVAEVFYGVSSDAVSCYELYGHSCEEELKMSKPDN